VELVFVDVVDEVDCNETGRGPAGSLSSTIRIGGRAGGWVFERESLAEIGSGMFLRELKVSPNITIV